MFVSRLALRLRASCTVSGCLQIPGRFGGIEGVNPPCRLPPCGRGRYSSKAAVDSAHSPQRWITLSPELEELLVPRKLAVSPLESWLSLRYSLPSLGGSTDPQPLEEGVGESEPKALPPSGNPTPGADEGIRPLSCKNVLEIRRRKMNRHKYKKLLKRTKFLRRRVIEGRRKRKQGRFERDLKRIWVRAGLKKAPEGWTTPKIYIKQYQGKGE